MHLQYLWVGHIFPRRIYRKNPLVRLSRSLRRLLVFFFQAEDGIRAPLVTGVQTCDLPIFPSATVKMRRPDWRMSGGRALRSSELASERSEERRVGKECRSRWAPDQ